MPKSSDDSNWVLENHTQRKHRVLSYYLSIWSKILGENFANLIYWDFYSGRGDYSEGEVGSPLLAMDISQRCFDEGNSKKRPINLTCVFIEKDRSCHDYLKKLLRDMYPDEEGKRWRLYRGECVNVFNKSVTSDSDQLYRKRIPRFFFIDPFGSPPPLDVIGSIMRKKYSECMITLMTEFINRYARDEKQEPNLKRVFGVDDLSALRSICERDDPFPHIEEYYRRRLRDWDGGRIRYVTQPFEMRPDRRDIPLYYLIGCSNYSLGFEKMHEAMRKVSNNEDFSYRGKREGVTSLEDFFGDIIGDIAEWIFNNVRHRRSTWNLIYVECCKKKTWARPQVGKAILRLEEEGKVLIYPRPGKKRIGKSLSDHIIEFQRDESFYEN